MYSVYECSQNQFANASKSYAYLEEYCVLYTIFFVSFNVVEQRATGCGSSRSSALERVKECKCIGKAKALVSQTAFVLSVTDGIDRHNSKADTHILWLSVHYQRVRFKEHMKVQVDSF